MASRISLSSSYSASVRAGRGIPVSLAGIRPGDVVVNRRPDRQNGSDELVRGVLAAPPDGWVARGDSSPCADRTMVTTDSLLGRVTHAERRGRARPVGGGRSGLLRAGAHQALLPYWRSTKTLGQRPQRRLRVRGLILRSKWPTAEKIRLATENGPLVNHVCGGRWLVAGRTKAVSSARSPRAWSFLRRMGERSAGAGLTPDSSEPVEVVARYASAVVAP
jgi:hypothetical protein